jgi:hypothetical protein
VGKNALKSGSFTISLTDLCEKRVAAPQITSDLDLHHDLEWKRLQRAIVLDVGAGVGP